MRAFLEAFSTTLAFGIMAFLSTGSVVLLAYYFVIGLLAGSVAALLEVITCGKCS